MNKYSVIEKRTLANALNFLGFEFYKYGQGKDAKYSFENTEKFRLALHELLKLRENLK